MADLKVVQFPEGPSLHPDDIPAQLRALADRIENGDEGEVSAVIAIIPRDQAYPKTMAWGAAVQAFDPIIQLNLAWHWHVRAAAGVPIE